MKFLVDNQLPAALALSDFTWRGLPACARCGPRGRHRLQDLGTRYAEDCVVISKDEDFLYLVNAPEAKGRFIWIRFGNCRTKALLTAIESLWPKVEARLKAGDRIIELR